MTKIASAQLMLLLCKLPFLATHATLSILGKFAFAFCMLCASLAFDIIHFVFVALLLSWLVLRGLCHPGVAWVRVQRKLHPRWKSVKKFLKIMRQGKLGLLLHTGGCLRAYDSLLLHAGPRLYAVAYSRLWGSYSVPIEALAVAMVSSVLHICFYYTGPLARSLLMILLAVGCVEVSTTRAVHTAFVEALQVRMHRKGSTGRELKA